MKNRQWVLAAHAQGDVTETNWTLVESDLPALAPGRILVRNRWLSVDPYMRGKLNVGAGMQPGDVMQGGGVGEVVESAHSAWKSGDFVTGLELGWQDYTVLNPDITGPSRPERVNPDLAPPQAALSLLGMPGFTAYFAMFEAAKPQAGDTVVVSAAGGAVGQIAGQIAKLSGCRVIGIAGADSKLAWCREIGFDETINYKTTPDLTGELRRICPEGVNVFFDGTGGPIHDAVLMNLATAARVAIVGRVAVANKPPSEDIGLRASSRMIATRATIQGFTVYDWWHRRDEAAKRLSAWNKAGAMQLREDVAEGIESVPGAFLRMMRGDNLGKQLIRL